MQNLTTDLFDLLNMTI